MSAERPPAANARLTATILGWLAGAAALAWLLAANAPQLYPELPSHQSFKIVFPAGIKGAGEPIVTTGSFGNADFLAVRYVDAEHAIFLYDVWGVGGPFSPAFAIEAGKTRTLEVDMPTLATVKESKSHEKRALRIVLDGQEILSEPVYFHRRATEEIYFAANPIGGGVCEASFRGTLATPDGRALRGRPAPLLKWPGQLARLVVTRPWFVLGAMLLSAIIGLATRATANWVAARLPSLARKILGAKSRNGPKALHLVTAPSTLTARIWSAFIIVATLTLYLWIGQSSSGVWPSLRPKGQHETDHFNILNHGFLKGHLYVDLAVPPAIINAANPYDPALRQTTEVLHDGSYYRGHYYLYFGPAPVVTLLVPFTLITGHDLPLPIAVWVFSIAGYLALAGIFFFVQRRHFPAASALAIVAALVALGTGNMLLTLLRRSHIWEFSLAAGFCFFTVSLFCLVRALYSRRATAWAAAGGLALGLAIASRPTYLLCCVLFTLPLWLRKKNPRVAAHYGWPALFAAGAICAAIGLVLAAYNYARFGNPLEFGITYQMSGTGGEINNTHFSLSYAGFNFRMYFLSALHWVEAFPFLSGADVPPRPAGQGGVEYTFGLFRNLPFSWFGLAALAGLLGWRARRDDHDQPWPVIGLVAASAVLNTVTPLLFFGSCVRYLVDFAPSFMLLAAFGFLAWESQLRSRLARGLLRGAGLVLAAYTAIVAVLTVVNFYDNAASSPPAAYRPLARALDWPLFQLHTRDWPDYAPAEIVFTLPADRSPRHEPLFTVTNDRVETALVFVDYVSEHSIRFGYRERGDDRTLRFSPVVPAEPGSVHTLRLSVGGPYAEFDGTKFRLRAQFDGFRIWDERVVSIDVFPGAVSFGENPAVTGGAGRFTGEIRTHRTIADTDIAGTAHR